MHDKGTFDAVWLNPNMDLAEFERIVGHLVRKPDGVFVVTSCNTTREELISTFSRYFYVHRVLPHREFRFGGRAGASVTTIAFSHGS